jgi:putative transposase
VFVAPETVVGWHRTSFRLYWRWRSQHQRVVGRKPIPKALRDLIFRIVAENPTWGAPRIHGELLKLGFDVSERTVSRWVQRAPKNPERARRWKTFLQNHREAIAAMDFFTVPTLTFQVLYCFFVIAHDWKRILHCNVTRHPTGLWITQQPHSARGLTRSPQGIHSISTARNSAFAQSPTNRKASVSLEVFTHLSFCIGRIVTLSTLFFNR